MPLSKPDDFGTSAEGFRVNDYCVYCFRDGKFTDPDITEAAMLEICVAAMVKQGVMPEAKARALMTDVLPRLERWRTHAPA